MPLREDQIRRYARHILLPDVGGEGQARLLSAIVGVRLAANCGAEVAALAYLAAAGVGQLRLIGDPEGIVTGTDVATGILYGHADIGRSRLQVVRERIAALNPDVAVSASPDGPIDVAITPPANDVAAALRAGGGAAVQLMAALIDARCPVPSR